MMTRFGVLLMRGFAEIDFHLRYGRSFFGRVSLVMNLVDQDT